MIIASVSALLSACGDNDARRPSARLTTASAKDVGRRLDAIQAVATLECQCLMAGRDVRALKARYSRLTDGLSEQGFATSSVPVSYESVCFPELGENACISTRAYLPPSGEDFVCSEAQGIEIEHVWNDAMPEEGGEIAMADQAADRRITQMREEMKRKMSQADCS
jgi:hypothetical protein